MVRIIVLLLLTLIKVVELSDSADDPSGWSSYYVTESPKFMDSVDVVDPSGWNYDRQTKESVRKENEDFDTNDVMINKVEDAVKYKIQTLFTKETNMNDNIVFVKRFISILLEAADLSEKTRQRGDYVSNVIEISMSIEQLKTLIHFSNSKVNVSLRELDHILSASIHRKHIPAFDVSTSIERIFFLATQKEVWLPLFLGCILLGILRLLITSKTKKCFVTSLVILIFCLSYVIEYYRMYKEVEIQQKVILEKHPDVPPSCNPTSRFWFASLMDSLMSSVTFKNDECEEYQRAILLDPLVAVSPVRVLSSILVDIIVEPSGKIATAITVFASAILGKLPIQYGWIVWMGSCIAVFVLIALAVVLLINGSIQFSYLFGGFKISSSQAPSVASTPQVPEIASDPARVSKPLLEGVTGIKNPVLIDASSLGTLLLRTPTNLAIYHSGIEELVQSPDPVSLPKPSEEMVSSAAQKTPLEAAKESLAMANEQEPEVIDMKSEMNSDIHPINNGGATSETVNPIASISYVERKWAETAEVEGKHTEDVSENVKNVDISEID